MPFKFPQHLSVAKNLFGLPFGEYYIIIGLLLLKLYDNVTHGWI